MKKNVKNTKLTAKQYAEIQRLYWEEGWAQSDISLEFLGHDNGGHISRIINGPPPMSWEEHRQAKSTYSKNYKAPKYKTPYVKKWIQYGREDTRKTKLTFKKAQEIRHIYFQGKHSQQDLANKYGISQAHTQRIISGKKWKKL